MFAISTARLNITPSVDGLVLGGYSTAAAGNPRRGSDVASHLYARAVAIWDNGKPRMVVSVDTLAITRYANQEVRRQLASTELMPADLIIACSHTHNAPALDDRLDPVVSYCASQEDVESVRSQTAVLIENLVTVIRAGLAAPQTTCTLDYLETEAHFSANREALAYTETVVPVITARAVVGSTVLAVIFGYGCHPVSNGMLTAFDADYPGVAALRLEAAYPHAVACFILGTAGDQNPIGPAGPHPADEFGTQLADAVEAAVDHGPGDILLSPISTRLAPSVQLPLEVTPTPANFAAVRALYVERLESVDRATRLHAAASIQRLEANSMPLFVSLPIQSWVFGGGGLTLIALGGEVVSGFDFHFRSVLPGNVWVAAYCNEVPGYIPSDELLDHAGYAAGWDDDAPGIAGGSMIYYDWPAHFRRGTPDGAESAVIATVMSLI